MNTYIVHWVSLSNLRVRGCFSQQMTLAQALSIVVKLNACSVATFYYVRG